MMVPGSSANRGLRSSCHCQGKWPEAVWVQTSRQIAKSFALILPGPNGAFASRTRLEDPTSPLAQALSGEEATEVNPGVLVLLNDEPTFFQ